jgi:hypothetical protein
LDKRASDSVGGKKEHELCTFEEGGTRGNIGNFNMMVQNVSGVMEQERIEMVPLVREGMDVIGRELIGGVREWLRWIGEKSGRLSGCLLRSWCGQVEGRWRGLLGQLSSGNHALCKRQRGAVKDRMRDWRG